MCGLTTTVYIYMAYVYYVCVSLDIVKSRNAIARTKELVVVSVIGTRVYIYIIILCIARSENQQKANRTAMLAKAH
jgi:hypothetical protein